MANHCSLGNLCPVLELLKNYWRISRGFHHADRKVIKTVAPPTPPAWQHATRSQARWCGLVCNWNRFCIRGSLGDAVLVRQLKVPASTWKWSGGEPPLPRYFLTSLVAPLSFGANSRQSRLVSIRGNVQPAFYSDGSFSCSLALTAL